MDSLDESPSPVQPEQPIPQVDPPVLVADQLSAEPLLAEPQSSDTQPVNLFSADQLSAESQPLNDLLSPSASDCTDAPLVPPFPPSLNFPLLPPLLLMGPAPEPPLDLSSSISSPPASYAPSTPQEITRMYSVAMISPPSSPRGGSRLPAKSGGFNVPQLPSVVDGLGQCVIKGDADGVEAMLLSPRAHTVYNFNTALLLAAKKGSCAIMELVLAASKAVVTSVADNPLHLNSPLYWAARSGHLEIVKLLIAAGANINPPMVSGILLPPLLAAAGYGHLGVVCYLVELGADIETTDNDGSSALVRAAGRGHDAVVSFLIERGAAIEHNNRSGVGALSAACREGYVECTHALLEAGAKVHSCDKHGSTPLHRAVRGQHMNIVKLLVAAGADKGLKDNAGGSPIYIAAQLGNPEIVHLLADRSSGLIDEAEIKRSHQKLSKVLLLNSINLID